MTADRTRKLAPQMGERVELDLERVANLESILGSDLPEILASLAASMSTRIAQAEEALADDRLADVTQARTGCRNDALMVGAQPMLAALSELEDASRGDRLEDAQAAMQRLRDVWPETRERVATRRAQRGECGLRAQVRRPELARNLHSWLKLE